MGPNMRSRKLRSVTESYVTRMGLWLKKFEMYIYDKIDILRSCMCPVLDIYHAMDTDTHVICLFSTGYIIYTNVYVQQLDIHNPCTILLPV